MEVKDKKFSSEDDILTFLNDVENRLQNKKDIGLRADIKGLDNLTNLLKLKKWKRKMLSTNLKRIRINGYKSIEKLDLQMSSINILIGAGKSNFISLFAKFIRG